MGYNPGQLRGPDGRWISTGARKVRRAARSKANKKAYAGTKAKKRSKPIRIDRAASRQERGVGFEGLKKNFIPYARFSRKSTTVGANTGAFIPGTDKRIVIGNYARIENAKRRTGETALSKLTQRIAPKGTKRGAVASHIRKNTKISNPAIRYQTSGTSSREGVQVRLGTSRKAGPTVIVRRGTHKRTRAESKSGIKQYDRRMQTLAGKKVSNPRPTRRRQAARRSKKKRNR